MEISKSQAPRSGSSADFVGVLNQSQSGPDWLRDAGPRRSTCHWCPRVTDMLKRSIHTIRVLSRKSIRAAAWLALGLLAGLTIFLFTATAVPIPARVHPWAEFGCLGILDARPGLSSDLRYSAVLERDAGDSMRHWRRRSAATSSNRILFRSTVARIILCSHTNQGFVHATHTPCQSTADESLIAIHTLNGDYRDYPMKGPRFFPVRYPNRQTDPVGQGRHV